MSNHQLPEVHQPFYSDPIALSPEETLQYRFPIDTVKQAAQLVEQHPQADEQLYQALGGLAASAAVVIEERPIAGLRLLSESETQQVIRTASDSAYRSLVGHVENGNSSGVNSWGIAEDSLVESLRRLASQTVEQATQAQNWALISDASEEVPKPELVRRMEIGVPVKHLPKFKDQVGGASDKEVFQFRVKNRKGKVLRTGEATEKEGLEELSQFLSVAANADPLLVAMALEGLKNNGKKVKMSPDEMIAEAHSMLENLSYIGSSEYAEAAKGLGEFWKAYLDEDSGRKICIIAEVGNLERYKVRRQRKSDDYLRDSILSTFTDEELERYSGRIVSDIKDLHGIPPEQVKVVLLDDWVVSGTQMRDLYAKLYKDDWFRHYADAGSVELNVIAASEDRLKNGLRLEAFDDRRGKLRVRSYYLTHDAGDVAVSEHEAHLTGLHSSVNYDFRNDLAIMAEIMALPQPGIGSIERNYRTGSRRISISASRLARVDTHADKRLDYPTKRQRTPRRRSWR